MSETLEVSYRTKGGEVRTGLGSAELIDVSGEQCALSVYRRHHRH